MKIADTYFGGTDKVKEELALAIQNERMAQGMTCERLDQVCGFGKESRQKIPSSAEFEKSPKLVTGKIFSRAAIHLGLRLDIILPLHLNGHLKEVIDLMQKEGARVTAACGGGEVSKIGMEKQAPVYLYLKLSQELDC